MYIEPDCNKYLIEVILKVPLEYLARTDSVHQGRVV